MRDALTVTIFAALTFVFLSLSTETGTLPPTSSVATRITTTNSNGAQSGSQLTAINNLQASSPSWHYTQPIFNPTKLESDHDYRRIVWYYWLDRNLEGSRRQAPELDLAISLCTSNGLPAPTCAELIRRLYADISDIQRFETFRKDVDEVKEKQITKVRSDSSTGDEQRAKVIAHLENVAENERQNWDAYAKLLRQISVERVMRESGIKNNQFFEAVYSIRFSQLATGVETGMAENEAIFD